MFESKRARQLAIGAAAGLAAGGWLLNSILSGRAAEEKEPPGVSAPAPQHAFEEVKVPASLLLEPAPEVEAPLSLTPAADVTKESNLADVPAWSRCLTEPRVWLDELRQIPGLSLFNSFMLPIGERLPLSGRKAEGAEDSLQRAASQSKAQGRAESAEAEAEPLPASWRESLKAQGYSELLAVWDIFTAGKPVVSQQAKRQAVIEAIESMPPDESVLAQPGHHTGGRIVREIEKIFSATNEDSILRHLGRRRQDALWLNGQLKSLLGEERYLRFAEEQAENFELPGALRGRLKAAVMRCEGFELEDIDSSPAHGVFESLEYDRQMQELVLELNSAPLEGIIGVYQQHLDGSQESCAYRHLAVMQLGNMAYQYEEGNPAVTGGQHNAQAQDFLLSIIFEEEPDLAVVETALLLLPQYAGDKAGELGSLLLEEALVEEHPVIAGTMEDVGQALLDMAAE